MTKEIAIRLALQGEGQVSSGLSKVNAELGRVGGRAGGAASGADALSAALGRVAHYGITGGALYGLTQTVMSAGKSLFDASSNAQRLVTQMNFATGGSGAKELEFVAGVANRLGLEMGSTAQAYAGFLSAARGTALEGAAARQVFEGIAKASAVMGLSADQSSGALLAVQQMMSKGVVSAEEFRGQLGERMPIALQAGAKALGVTTAEFSKMLEAGQIIAQDFLPKFSAAITEMLGDSVEQAANRLDAATAQMGNSWTRLKATVGDSGVSQAIANEAKGLSNYLDSISDAMKRAEQNGAGMSRQLLTGFGQVIARAPFDVLSASGNLFNGVLNTLSMGALNLNTNINLLPTALDTTAQQALVLERDLKAAEEKLADLKASGADTTQNIYIQSSYAAAVALVNELRAAKDAQDALKQGKPAGAGRGSVNPPMADTQQRVQDLEAVNALRLRLSGVPSGYIKEMQEIIRLNQAGVLIGKEYTDALAKQQAALLKTKAATGGLVKEQDGQAKLLAELSGLSGSFAAEWQLLTTAYKAGKLSLDGLTAAQAALLAKQPAMKAAADEEKNAQEVLTRAYQEAAAERIKIAQSMEQQATSAADQNQALRDEIELIGLTEEQQTRVLQQRNEAIILTKEATLAELERASAITGTMTREQIALAAEIEALKERNELLGAKSVKNTAVEAAKKAEDEWKKTTDEINESLTDALMRGFESGKDFAKNMRDTVVNMFKTMVLRPVISAVMSPVAGAINGMLYGNSAAAVGGGANALGMLGSGANLISGLQGTSGMLGTVGGWLGMNTAAANAGLAATIGIDAASATAAANAASAAVSGFMGTVGAAMPWIAGAAAIMSIVSSLDDSGTYHTGGAAQYSAATGLRTSLGFRDNEEGLPSYNPNDNIDNQFGTGFGYVERGDQTISAVSTLAQSLGTALDGVAVAFGQKAGYEIATAFADDTSEDGAWGALRISKEGRELLNWQDTRTSRWAPREFGDGEEGYKQYLAAVAKDTRQVLLDMDLPGWADNVLQAIGDSPSIEDISAALTQIGQAQAVFKSFGQYMSTFATLADSSVTKLAAASGGIGALAGNMSTFVDQFYTDAEKLAVNTENVREAMGKLGFELPATRDEFKALVQAQLALGDAGAETAAGLLGLSGAFASVTESVKDMTASLDDYISKTARSSTEADRIRGLQAVGNTAALKRLGVPGYASGGYHAGGLRLVGENGPELEVTGPANIISNPVTEQLLRGSGSADTARLEALVEKLTAEVANLRAETRAVVTHTATTARIIKRVTPDGDAIATREAAPV